MTIADFQVVDQRVEPGVFDLIDLIAIPARGEEGIWRAHLAGTKLLIVAEQVARIALQVGIVVPVEERVEESRGKRAALFSEFDVMGEARSPLPGQLGMLEGIEIRIEER